jgi:mannose-1-phosphate guanylyltransferase
LGIKPSMALGSVLFSAGRGKRMRPLSDEIPKPALPVLDIPLGAFGLKRLLSSYPPVAVNVSHLPDAIDSALSRFGDFELFREPVGGLGTGGTLKALEDVLAPTFITLNADALIDLDIEMLAKHHRDSGALATGAVVAVGKGADFVGTGVATSFIDRRIDPDAPGLRFVGAAAFSHDVLKLIPDEPPVGLGETVFPLLVDRGELALYEHDGYALDVGTPASYLRANLDLLHNRFETLAEPPGEIIEVEGGRAYIGLDAQVGKRSVKVGAIILFGAEVGLGASIENAIVMPGETVAPSEHLAGAIAWAGGRLKLG